MKIKMAMDRSQKEQEPRYKYVSNAYQKSIPLSILQEALFVTFFWMLISITENIKYPPDFCLVGGIFVSQTK